MAQTLLFLTAAMLIAEASALFYFKTDQKQQKHEEVEHHNYQHYQHHHHYHHPDEHKHQHLQHHEYKLSEHKPQYLYRDYTHHYYPHHIYEHIHPTKHIHYEPAYHSGHKHHSYEHIHHGHGHSEHGHETHKRQEQPHYEFKYGVRDSNTGDIKKHWEIRKGDNVLGEYSFVEADGTIRTVQYMAGKHTGFNAVVKKEGEASHPSTSDYSVPRNFNSFYSPKAFHSNPNRNSKPVHLKPAYDVHEPKTKNSGMSEAGATHPHPLPTRDLPANHKPVFTGIDEGSNLLALYRHYPVHVTHAQVSQGLDYNIGEYLSKRSYNLKKLSETLNVNSRNLTRDSEKGFDAMRAVRGAFAMGR